MRCENCGGELTKVARHFECMKACALYNAGVAAQGAAAKDIALQRFPGSTDAYLNEYGIWARVAEVMTMVGLPEEAAPFVELTSAALRVRSRLAIPAPRKKARSGKGVRRG